MEWLNYHHLFYFWMVAKQGTISAAAEQLHLARPTVTAQVRDLENAMGQKLFQQQGRRLVLTDFGQQVLVYADQIFSVGQELREFLQSGHGEHRKRFRVGMSDFVPKLIAFELLKPALQTTPLIRTVCTEGKFDQLLADLVVHKLDLVVSDSPAPRSLHGNVYSHLLGECGLSLLAVPALAKRLRRGFPGSLNVAPLLLPTEQTAIRPALDQWLEQNELHPEIVAEFEDSGLLKIVGQSGKGVFPVPTAIESAVKRQYRVSLVGKIPEIRDAFYALSVEKRVQHPAALAIVQQARSALFEATANSTK